MRSVRWCGSASAHSQSWSVETPNMHAGSTHSPILLLRMYASGKILQGSTSICLPYWSCDSPSWLAWSSLPARMHGHRTEGTVNHGAMALPEHTVSLAQRPQLKPKAGLPGGDGGGASAPRRGPMRSPLLPSRARPAELCPPGPGSGLTGSLSSLTAVTQIMRACRGAFMTLRMWETVTATQDWRKPWFPVKSNPVRGWLCSIIQPESSPTACPQRYFSRFYVPDLLISISYVFYYFFVFPPFFCFFQDCIKH